MTGIKQPETEQAPAQGANDLWYTRTPQQEDMQAAARDFVSRHAPVERLLVHGDGQAGTDDGRLWKLLHEQLGGQAVVDHPLGGRSNWTPGRSRPPGRDRAVA